MSTFLEEALKGVTGLGYTIGDHLSSNNNAHVYRASGSDGVPVVLKLYSDMFMRALQAGGMSPEQLDNLRAREMKVLKQLKHPCLPKLVATHKFDIMDIPVHVLAMEYLQKPSLHKQCIAGGEQLGEAEARKVLEDCLGALDYLHTAFKEPIYHRDIKPSNILFDDKGAAIVDFNVCKTGNGTSELTMIGATGYYPLDAYSGIVDPTQDLVALGNVVVAALKGKELAQLRNEQVRYSLEEPVDLADLEVSELLRIFLTKLTATKPGLRYQSAKAALDDLSVLHTRDPKQLAASIAEQRRDPRLEGLLGLLERHDHLYHYNVPAKLRGTASDAELLRFLEKVYAQPMFTVDETAAITRYVQQGDRVRARRDLHNILVPAGAAGSVKAPDGVKWDVRFTVRGTEQTYAIPVDELEVTGQVVKFIFRHMREIFSSGARDIEPFPASTLDRHRDPDFRDGPIRVRYNPKNKKGLLDTTRGVPKGGEGLVLAESANEVLVVWETLPGLVAPITHISLRKVSDGTTQIRMTGDSYYNDGNGIMSLQREADTLVTPAIQDIVLLRRNFVPFEDLRKQAYAPVQEAPAAPVVPAAKPNAVLDAARQGALTAYEQNMPRGQVKPELPTVDLELDEETGVARLSP